MWLAASRSASIRAVDVDAPPCPEGGESGVLGRSGGASARSVMLLNQGGTASAECAANWNRGRASPGLQIGGSLGGRAAEATTARSVTRASQRHAPPASAQRDIRNAERASLQSARARGMQRATRYVATRSGPASITAERM